MKHKHLSAKLVSIVKLLSRLGVAMISPLLILLKYPIDPFLVL